MSERRDDFGERQIVVAKRDVEFVEHEETDRGIGHHALGFRPGGARRRDIARAVLRLPGEALAHRAPLDLVAEALDGHPLARRPRALDELHHANAMATPERRATRARTPRSTCPCPGRCGRSADLFRESASRRPRRPASALRFAIFALWRSSSGRLMKASGWRRGEAGAFVQHGRRASGHRLIASDARASAARQSERVASGMLGAVAHPSRRRPEAASTS